MPRFTLEKKLNCKITDVEEHQGVLRVCFTPLRGAALEVEDLITLGARDTLQAVKGVGRVLRILRAGRIRAPKDPYTFCDNPQLAVDLIERCIGSEVSLKLRRRLERSLTVWSEEGVEKIRSVLDWQEDSAGLTVYRRGGQSTMIIPRDQIIRFEASSTEYFEVTSIDNPAGSRLR